MVLIANRGNLFGRNPERENSPDYLNEAIVQGYHVMIDTWWMDGCFWFGRNYPCWKSMGGGQEWLQHAMNSVWLRAKNPGALVEASTLGLNVFWHQSDSYVLSTWGNLLGFYGAGAYGDSFVHIIPEHEFLMDTNEVDKILSVSEQDYGICSDHVGTIEQVLTLQNV